MDAAHEGLPPAFLAAAECDILAEQSAEMAQRLRAAGVPVESIVYPGASHSFLEAVSIAAVIGWWLMFREDRRRQRDMQLALQENG